MRLLAGIAVALGVWAQQPVSVQFQCTAEDGQLLRQNCTNAEPCPVYLDLSSLEVVGPKVFVAGNLHTEASTLYSILMTSGDGGVTWAEPHERMRNAGLDQIQFLDFETGWISGHTLLGIPKDPFLLITKDGGKTWRPQPIFEESGAGMIEQFWFDSKTSGALVIDRVQASETGARYELYETMTGGTSWILRQAGASAIPLKRNRGASLNPDWRLRTDANSKTHRLEHRESGKWTAVSSFPVRVGECKEMEQALPEPPPLDADNAASEEPRAETGPARPLQIPSLKKKRPQ